MAGAFARISFTDAVKAEQRRYGSREHYRALDDAADAVDLLGRAEADFIAQRNSFFQATVAANGWPYVQHRGGPPGFLRVIDTRTLAFADFRGNGQYLSSGNLAGDDRISLILVDHAAQRRLKIWGRARIVHAHDDAALVRQLHVDNYRARAERAVIISVEAIDWNCPQHIPRLFAAADLLALQQENTALKQAVHALQAQLAAHRPLPTEDETHEHQPPAPPAVHP